MSVWQARTRSPHTERGRSLGVERWKSVGRHGRHWELTDSCDSVEMSEVGFTGVKPALTVQGQQNIWQLPDAWWLILWMIFFYLFKGHVTKRNEWMLKGISIKSSWKDNLVHDTEIILDLNSAEIKSRSIRENLRGDGESGNGNG